MVVGCATVLNNAIMSRGSRQFTLTLVGPSALVLIATPALDRTLSGQLHLHIAALLTIGVIAYVVFIARLAETLHRESLVLQRALDAAESANRAKSAFLATVSHEIRTPLNGVLGMAQAMRVDPLSPVQSGRLDVISQSGEALLRILNDILDLSKIESGKLDLEMADFDLEAAVKDACAAFAPTAALKGVGLELTVSPDVSGGWRGDATRVRQIFYNLIANAVKFTDAGQVKVSVEMIDEGVRFEVLDTGVGIPADRIEALFDKFVQADSSITRRFGGTGLGLAICRELCVAMGGRIAVTSTVGEGSRFTVDLPLARASRSALAVAPPPANLTPLTSGDTLRVLAAEDNPINQLVLRTLLGQIGIDPTIVNDGAAAVAAWEASDWDLILMDVQMPVMDGPSAARAIRAREAETRRPATPIVALTANAMSHQLDDYLAAGMTGFVAKPIEVAALFAAIQSAASEAGADEAAA
jgi:signal transduction histidine kinase/ActR/RegA family two-component response regulator